MIFNGIDMKVNEVQTEYFDGLGFGAIKIFFRFEGDFNGKKKINSKLINVMKAQPGFQDFITDSIMEVLKCTHTREVTDFINRYDDKKVSQLFGGSYANDKLATWYIGNRIMFDLSIAKSDFEDFEAQVLRLIDAFVHSHRSNINLQSV